MYQTFEKSEFLIEAKVNSTTKVNFLVQKGDKDEDYNNVSLLISFYYRSKKTLEIKCDDIPEWFELRASLRGLITGEYMSSLKDYLENDDEYLHNSLRDKVDEIKESQFLYPEEMFDGDGVVVFSEKPSLTKGDNVTLKIICKMEMGNPYNSKYEEPYCYYYRGVEILIRPFEYEKKEISFFMSSENAYDFAVDYVRAADSITKKYLCNYCGNKVRLSRTCVCPICDNTPNEEDFEIIQTKCPGCGSTVEGELVKCPKCGHHFKEYEPGNKLVKFGSYNGEIIEWIVIKEDGDYGLVLSKKVLDAMRYDNESQEYEKSEVRNWLLTRFYNKAFSDKEKSKIRTFSFFDYDEKKPIDKDPVFLLSRDELRSFFLKSKEALAKGTAWANENGLRNEKGFAPYWVRNDEPDFPFSFDEYVRVFYVTTEGYVSLKEANDKTVGVRPACWVLLK